MMKKASRKAVALVAGAAGMVLALAAMAWACSPQQFIATLRPATAAPGDQVTLEGYGANPGDVVDLLWNGTEGQKLAQGIADPSGKFSFAVTVPQVPPGVYAFVSVAPSVGAARMAIEVTSEDSLPGQNRSVQTQAQERNASSDLWNGFSEGSAAMQAELGNTPRSGFASSSLALGLAISAIGVALVTAGSAVALRRRYSRTH